MTHYGKENAHEVTDVMRWFAREIIDAGADMVLGGHSIGIYPVEEYNGKIIIYSLGYLIHDTNNESGKKSAIFNIDIDTEGKVKQLEIIPTYIDNKVSVKMYKDINEEKSKKLLEELNNGSKFSSYISEIKNDLKNHSLFHLWFKFIFYRTIFKHFKNINPTNLPFTYVLIERCCTTKH